MIDLFAPSTLFLVSGVGVPVAGVYALVRGSSRLRRLSFFQTSLATGLWMIAFGALAASEMGPEARATVAELFVLLGAVVALTVYQFVTHGLGFGPPPPGRRERRRGVVALWGICAAVGVLVATGTMELVAPGGAGAVGSGLRLHWHAVPVVFAAWMGILGALLAVQHTWRRSPSARRSRGVVWVALATAGFAVVPLALHTALFGSWGSGVGALAVAVAAVLLGATAALEPSTGRTAFPPVDAILKSLKSPALAVGRDTKIQATNEPFCEAYGYRGHQLDERHLDDLVEDLSGSQLPLSALSLEVKGEGRKVRIRSGDGEVRPALVIASQLGHVDGEALPNLFLFAPESPAGGAVRRSGALERWLRQGFRPDAPALALCDPREGRFSAVNDQFLQLVGYAREDVLGRTASDLELPVYQNRWSEFLRQLRESGVAKEIETELHRGGGEMRHAEFRGVSVESAGGTEALILARDLTTRKEAEDRLRGEVLYDALTGLPNRVLFREQLDLALKRAQRHHSRVAVLFVDLNGFKAVNDTYGHAAGDQLLSAVAWRLYECFREMDTLCRYGGDEFLVLLEDQVDAQGAAAAADRFRRSLEAPFKLEDRTEVNVGATIGAAVSVPGQTDGETLIQQADVAMYRAKRRGESPIRVYDPERDAGERERLSQADDLRKAIERRELALYYQPLIRLEDRSVVGAEALIRWPQPSGEVRTPGEFLPLAEETGLVIPMSEWIFEAAARQARAWRTAVPEFKMSVNVAAQHFRDPSLVDTFEDILDEVDLPAHALQLEITESAALRDARAIDRLRERGLTVVADDFGTGYSSLEYVRGLGVDGVKIDRAFISPLGDDPKDQAIVKAMLLIADAFDLEVTAEGIETEEQLRWLREAGCPTGQGYYFARPLPPEEFEPLLREGMPIPSGEGAG